MLDLHWECIDYKLNKKQGILQIFMLAPLLSTDGFGLYGNKEVI